MGSPSPRECISVNGLALLTGKAMAAFCIKGAQRSICCYLIGVPRFTQCRISDPRSLRARARMGAAMNMSTARVSFDVASYLMLPSATPHSPTVVDRCLRAPQSDPVAVNHAPFATTRARARGQWATRKSVMHTPAGTCKFAAAFIASSVSEDASMPNWH